MRHTPPSRKLVLAFALALAGALGPRAAPAADQKAALAKIKAKYQAAAAAYDDGEFEKVEAHLQQALKLAEDNGLSENKVVAQTYVLYGVLEVAGLKNTAQGVKYLAKAIEISPAIQVPPTMASKAVLAAFERAENQESEPATARTESARTESARTESARTESAQAEATEASEEAKPSKPAGRGSKAKPGPARDADSDKLADDLAAAKVSESLQQAEKERLQKEKQEQDKELASTKGHAQELAKEKAEQERQLAEAKSKLRDLDRDKQERDKQLADLKAQLGQLTKEKQAVDKQLAASQASEKKEREASNKLAQDKSQSDSQLGDSKRSLQELAKQKADLERQLAAALADAKKEREAKEKLAAAKADADRQLADQKRNLQDLTKQKADADRQLAAALADAKKEREAKEKLVAARREADARENERKNKETEERAKLEKLAEGPDLPAHVTEPISCTVPDEIPPGADLYVHCVPRPGVDAKVVALYYRAGGVLYNVSTMDRSKKGWFTAVIPGGKIAGKVLHYYVEARNGRSDVVGSNGHANSPNIATIRGGKK
jgi:hypothetical protein